MVDQIHLVHQHDDLPDSQHCKHVAMPPGVFLNPLMRIDDQQGGLGTGRTGDHVLEELNVAGRVDDDVIALGRFEEASGGVDGDALGLFVLECVEQKRILKWARVLAASRFDLFEFAFRQRMRVRHEASDDGALAMIDMADHDDVHLLACGCRAQASGELSSCRISLHACIHHMYPSLRNVSRPPPSSLSCALPERSAMLANFPLRSSAMISGMFRDSESTGLVQGQQPSER